MQTAAVYLTLSGLMLWAWPHGRGIILPALAVNFASSAIMGWTVSRTPDREVGMILCDLALIYALRFGCSGVRPFFVGLIGIAAILLRIMHMGGSSAPHWWYAAILNAAFAAQIAIAGGAGDGVGHWLDDRLVRIWPRGAGLFRDVAGVQ